MPWVSLLFLHFCLYHSRIECKQKWVWFDKIVTQTFRYRAKRNSFLGQHNMQFNAKDFRAIQNGAIGVLVCGCICSHNCRDFMLLPFTRAKSTVLMLLSAFHFQLGGPLTSLEFTQMLSKACCVRRILKWLLNSSESCAPYFDSSPLLYKW